MAKTICGSYSWSVYKWEILRGEATSVGNIPSGFQQQNVHFWLPELEPWIGWTGGSVLCYQYLPFSNLRNVLQMYI